MKSLYVLVFIVCLFVSPCFAHFAGLEKWTERLSPEIGVEFPVSFAVHSKVNLNRKMYFRLGVGSSSELLLKNMYRTNLMSVDKEKMDLLVDSLANSLYSEIRVGFRNHRQKGFYGEAGYSFMSLGKGETSSDKLMKSINRVNLSEKGIYEVQSIVHNATLHGGYVFPVLDKMGLSVEVGLVKPLASNVQVDYKDKLPSSAEQKDSKKVKKIFEEVFVFTGSLWLSYIF